MIIDAHTHVGSKGEYYGKASNWSFDSSYSGSRLVELMDQEGIDKAVCFGMGHTGPTEGVKFTIDAVQKHPDRLIGFYRADPWCEGVVRDFEVSVREYGLSGLKLHPIGQGFAPSHPTVHHLMAKAAELRVPCTIHSHQYGTAGAGSQPALIGELAAAFPEVPVIMAHMGMYLYRDAMYVAERQPNIILETSAQPWTHRILRLAVNRIGVERVIFGSDAPLHHPRVELMKIHVSDLSDEEKRQVLGLNIARLLSIAT